MANLVLEQGETLQRIEDDVEAGLDQAVQVILQNAFVCVWRRVVA